MSWRSILGVVALNGWFTAVGVCVVFALQRWRSWSDVLRYVGLAYMTGVSAVGIALAWQLTVGIDLSVASILVVGAVIASAGVVLGVRRGHRPPVWPQRPHLSPLPLVSMVGAALTFVYLEAQFRSGRLAGLYEFDAWSFWVPKAKAIYFFGGLDEQLFRELPGPSYPPLVPAVEAADFHFMGQPDEVTLHLQFWFFLAGFVWALVGLLAGRSPRVVRWASVLLVLVTPQIVTSALQAQADVLLDEFVALAVVATGLWILEREGSLLAFAALFLAAAVLTKREGLVLAGACVTAAVVATVREERAVWGKALAVGVLVLLALAPWRVFLLTRSLPGGGPEAGGVGLLTHAERAWPSLRLAFSTLFDFHVWLIVVPVFVVAVGVALMGGRRQLGTYAAVFSVLCVACFTWSTWAFPSLAITKEAALNPIVRFSGALTFAAAGLIPLLLGGVVARRRL
ncbi:MAG: hypothetical protein ACJ74D_04620 [Gaiellaceae bacterium]